MKLRTSFFFALAAAAAAALPAQEAPAEAPAQGAAAENPEVEAEIAYVEALVNNGYPDIAAPVIEETKKRWPETEARFFAIEVRGLLALGKFDDAEKKIAALPDRKSTKFWAARLEVANNYFGRGQKADCMKIYDEFFKVFQKPPAEIRKFYQDACYAYGVLLAEDRQYAKAAQRYEALLAQLPQGEDAWCNVACETVEIYLRLADEQADPKQKKAREATLKSAGKIVDLLLWQLNKPVYFGRAVSMKAHIEEMRGDVAKASAIIDEYRPQLEEIHGQIVDFDKDGKMGLLKQSPLPECMYLQAKMLWDEARREFAKKPKRDDEKVKAYMFGPKGANSGKRVASKGAFTMAVTVFLKYETSAWAAAAGDLSEEIRAFAEKEYKAKIKTKITPEQIAKVRAAQFRDADEKFVAQKYEDAISAYSAALAKYPEIKESVRAVENMASALLDLWAQTKDEKKRDEYRMDADAIEGYLSERFCEHRDRLIMISAGDAMIRLAAKESEFKDPERADRLHVAFFTNYRSHPTAATLAAAKAGEMQKAERYADAVRYWGIIAEHYTNSSFYVVSLSQLSQCYGKLGDHAKEIDYIKAYIPMEKVKIRNLQAQFQLAQMYQRDGMEIIDAAATNEAEEAVLAMENRGTAQIIRAVKSFNGFSKEADAALADPGTGKEDAAKYRELREAAMIMNAECWGRMKRPEKNLKLYRERAAKAYEAYVAEYPEGKWAKGAYVKLGTIYTALGDMEKSKTALDRLSRTFPDSDEAKNAKPRLAKNLIEMGLRKEGTEIYAEMLRTDGAYTAGQFLNAGDALIEAKSWDLANQAYEKSIRLAGTNSPNTVAKARLGQARSSWKQGSLAEAREALDLFLQDPKMAKMAIAADANFMLVEVASEQGRTEKDAVMRSKCFGTAIGALKKVRQYWSKKPQWEQDTLALLSGDVLVNRMKAEDAMGLKEAADETCGKAAAVFQVFIQAHGPTEERPVGKMEPGEAANLERAYATMVPLFARLGSSQADRVMKFGQEYLDLFPEGRARTEIGNCMNQAKADLPEGKLENAKALIPLSVREDEMIFMNGYQTWTYCPEYTVKDKIRGLHGLPKFGVRKFDLDRYGDYHFVDYPNKAGITHGISYCYFRLEERFRLIASLNEEPGYTLFTFDAKAGELAVKRDCAGILVKDGYPVFDLFFAEGSEDEVFDAWFKELGIQPKKAAPLTGYSSWYNRYENITEADMLQDLEGCARVLKPGDLFQIDDGWEPAVGDWLEPDPEKFPHGMKYMVDKIHEKGFKAGLWLAPFAAAKKSAYYMTNREQLCTHEGELWSAGCNWGGFYALDIDDPEAVAYIRETFRCVFDEWGFDLVKLDFLYAAAFFGTEKETRAGRMIRAMKLLREVCGDKLILGCGVPVMPAFGLVDYCRISCDVGLDWNDKGIMKYIHRERVSTKQAIGNAVFRRELNGRAYGSDPDVFFLREENIRLSSDEKKLLAVNCALFSTILLCSDDMSKYSDRQIRAWEQIQKIRRATDVKVNHAIDKEGKRRLEVSYVLDGTTYSYGIPDKN